MIFNINSTRGHTGSLLVSNYNRANGVAGNRLLERLMSPSPKSRLCSRPHSHESVISFRIFGIHTFHATATLLNI